MLNDLNRPENNILIVDDDPANIRLLVDTLGREGYRVRPAKSGEWALSTIDEEIPDLILLDIRMPGMNGYEVCQELKKRPTTKNIPIIFLSAAANQEDKIRAFQSGGVDYITKPIQVEEVIARVDTHLKLKSMLAALEKRNRELEEKNEIIRQMAMSDPLTSLSNRRHFLEGAEKEHAKFKRSGRTYAIIMIDIDFFKKVNDEYGHDAGDLVLKKTAAIIKDEMREQDYVARWGGEEFILLLPETDESGARMASEKLRKAIGDYEYSYQDLTISATLTIGIGVSCNNNSLETIIKRADEALYMGKNTGRDKVVVFGCDHQPEAGKS